MTAPAWNSMGVLPPVQPDAHGASPDRSPYAMDMISLADRFGTSQQRITILRGLLRFRDELYQAGLVSGFQWLDGSFLENVELLEDRPPHDIDVVTFYCLPSGQSQQSIAERHGKVFDHNRLKTDYTVDAYFAELGRPTDRWQIKNVSYWYSVWSHRRDGLWKGFVQVDLSPKQDADASTLLNNFSGGVEHE